MFNESLKAIRKAMLASFVLVAVWLLALPATVSELEARHDAEQLTAWLVLKNKFIDSFLDPPNREAFHERFRSATAGSDVIDSEMVMPPPENLDLRGGGDTSLVPQAIALATQWPGEKTPVTLHLRKHVIEGPYELYEVQSDAHFLPFDQYDVVVDASAITVVARKDWPSNPRLLQFAFNLQNQPQHWGDLSARLWPGVVEPPAAAKLQQSDPLVAAFVRDTLKSQHSVWGVSLDPGFFFPAPGILLGALAFMLLGPLMNMQRRDANPSEPWIMTLPTRSPRRPVLEGILLLISVAWCLVPISIGGLQVAQAIALHPFERACYWIGMLGLAFASIVNGIALWQLRGVRRRVA